VRGIMVINVNAERESEIIKGELEKDAGRDRRGLRHCNMA